MATNVYAQYAWDGRYIDAPVLRWRDPNEAGQTLSETLYYANDGNFNVTALVDPNTGDVVERYVYDPYGKATFLAGDWSGRSSSSYANEILYCGYRYDTESGLYHVRNRMYHPGLGRWMQRDKIGYRDGMNVQQYAGDSPIHRRDALGLFESSEASEIDNLSAAIEAADKIASDKSALGLMRWGRFTAAMGGAGAYEAVVGADSGSSRKTPFPRYIYTCRCGMVDLRHFYQLMYIAVVMNNAKAVQQGIEHEEGAEAASRYAPEDITSNALGAYFGNQQSVIQRRSVFVANLKVFLTQCDPVDWSKLTEKDKKCVIDWYAVDKDGDDHRRKTAGSDADCCKVCPGRNSTFPFAVDPKNSAMITGGPK